MSELKLKQALAAANNALSEWKNSKYNPRFAKAVGRMNLHADHARTVQMSTERARAMDATTTGNSVVDLLIEECLNSGNPKLIAAARRALAVTEDEDTYGGDDLSPNPYEPDNRRPVRANTGVPIDAGEYDAVDLRTAAEAALPSRARAWDKAETMGRHQYTDIDRQRLMKAKR